MSAARVLKAVVVDDEIDARNLVIGMLREHPDVEFLGQASNGVSAIELIRRVRPDLVFLDVQMPDIDGFEVIRRLEVERMPHIIFVTAYDEFAINAFEVNALDYLLKPFSRKRFIRALDRTRQAIHRDEAQTLAERLKDILQGGDLSRRQANEAAQTNGYVKELTVSTGSRLYTLKIADVDVIESADHYVKLHSQGRSYMIHESISGLEAKLDPAEFTRIHRTKIVRITAIREIVRDGDRAFFIVLTDGGRHRISRSQLGKLPKLVPPTPRQ